MRKKRSPDSIEPCVNRRVFMCTAAQVAGAVTASAFVPKLLKASLASSTSGISATVTTRTGKVRGRIVDGVNEFKGIPFGAPTGGANRFMPPQPPQPWTGVRDAFEFGHYAPQSNRSEERRVGKECKARWT